MKFAALMVKHDLAAWGGEGQNIPVFSKLRALCFTPMPILQTTKQS